MYTLYLNHQFSYYMYCKSKGWKWNYNGSRFPLDNVSLCCCYFSPWLVTTCCWIYCWSLINFTSHFLVRALWIHEFLCQHHFNIGTLSKTEMCMYISCHCFASIYDIAHYKDFQEEIHRIFPLIIDTKSIATHLIKKVYPWHKYYVTGFWYSLDLPFC